MHHQRHPLIDFVSQPYVVIKNVGGSHGDNIQIERLAHESAILDILRQCPKAEEIVLEGFVPSKPHRIKNREHDGCMRFLIDGIVDQSRQSYETIFQTAYWRLSPLALDSKNKNITDQLKANYSGLHPAIPKLIGPAEFARAEKVVHEVLMNILALEPNLFAQSSQHSQYEWYD